MSATNTSKSGTSKKKLLSDKVLEDITVTVNKKFAEKYENKKRDEELARLQAKYKNEPKDLEESENDDDDEESSDSEEEDEDGVLAGDVAGEFMSVLSRIVTRDPTLKQEKKFFENLDASLSDESSDEGEAEQKPVYFKDLAREEIVSQMTGKKSKDFAELPHFEQSAQAKKELLEAVKVLDGDDDDGGLLKKREKTAAEKEAEQNEYKQFLEERTKKQKNGKSDKLVDFWVKEDLPEDEKFLRDFILGKKWVNTEKEEAIPHYHDIVQDPEEDEEELDQQDDFENAYNFRGAFKIQSHARHPEDSVRVQSSKRKEARVRLAEKKRREKKQREDEKRRLMKLKQEQIIARLKKIRDVTGAEDMGINEDVLAEEFDGDKFDKTMEQTFDNNYYDTPDTEKPVWDDDEDEVYDHYKKTLTKDKKGKTVTIEDLIQQKGPRANEDQELAKYLEDYYNLDYEDMIGDTPCRFKYVSVTPNNYKLDAAQILTMDDSELRSIVSLKRLAPYREDQGKIDMKKLKAERYRKRKLEEKQRKEKRGSSKKGSSKNDSSSSKHTDKKRRTSNRK